MRLFSKVPVAIVLIILVSTYYVTMTVVLDQDHVSCGTGTVLIDDQCTRIVPLNNPNIVEIEVDFIYGEIVVNEGDYVRLIFTKDAEQHYLANSFQIPELNISETFGVEETGYVDVISFPAGTYAYESDGACRVNIPGSEYVVVDCSIFCGETENSVSGTLIVTPNNASDIDSGVCALLPDYCDKEAHH